MYQLKQRFDFSTITCSAISTFLYRLSCLPACSTGLPPFLFPLLRTTKILLLLTFFVVVPDYKNFLRSHSYYQSHSHHKPYFILKLCFLPSFFLSVYAIINIIFKFTLSLCECPSVCEREQHSHVFSPVALSSCHTFHRGENYMLIQVTAIKRRSASFSSCSLPQ